MLQSLKTTLQCTALWLIALIFVLLYVVKGLDIV